MRYGTTMEHMTARETGTICDTIDGTIDLKRRHRTEYHATSRMPMPHIIETEKLLANLHERRGGERDDIRLDGYGEGVPLPVSLAVSLHASLAIAPACLTTGGVLSLRCFPLTLSDQTVRRAGRRPVFRTVAPPRFPLFRLPYSAAFSTLPCLAASMSWRVRKPIAWPQSRQTSW